MTNLEASPLPIAKSLVLLTRRTTCECGERYSIPELYERHTPSGRWNLTNINHLHRRTTMPPFRLPLERMVVEETVPFCDTCLTFGAPLAGLPLPPQPDRRVDGVVGASPSPRTNCGEPATVKKPTVAARKGPAALTLDSIFSGVP